MKILLTGKNGMVGWELNRSLLPLGEVIALDRSSADLSNPESLRDVIRNAKPDVIVNAAAYTAVDKAEEEEELATIINGHAAAIMAEEAKACGALLVHYSTDYVFDGTKDGPYLETDNPNPVNAYGRSKLAGEQAIQASGVNHLIFRTSWVYAARGQNFLLTMLRLMAERSELGIVADQVGAPTCARTIADVTAHCLRTCMLAGAESQSLQGVYNLVNSGETSWHGFASRIAEVAEENRPSRKLEIRTINKISTEDYPTPAARPANSRLALEKLSTAFNLHLPAWDEVLPLVIADHYS